MAPRDAGFAPGPIVPPPLRPIDRPSWYRARIGPPPFDPFPPTRIDPPPPEGDRGIVGPPFALVVAALVVGAAAAAVFVVRKVRQ